MRRATIGATAAMATALTGCHLYFESDDDAPDTPDARIAVPLDAVASDAGVPTPTPDAEPEPAATIRWETGNAWLEATGFRIVTADGRVFTAADVSVEVQSDPGYEDYTTLEMMWREHDVPMRLYLYFRSDGDTWWSDELRTYDGGDPGDWVTYEGERFRSPMGEPFDGSLSLSDPSGARLEVSRLRLQAFTLSCDDTTPPYFIHRVNNPLTVPLAPNAYGGTFADLRDSTCARVLDQRGIVYAWAVDDEAIATITPVRACQPGASSPCPMAGVEIRGVAEGTTPVEVAVTREGAVLTSMTWDVLVRAY